MNTIVTTTLYANPYDISYTGFYFTSTEEFESNMNKAPFEEVEIDFIDGNNPRLFNATNINQGNVDLWFDELDRYEDNHQEALAICYLIEIMHLDEAIKRKDEVILYRGSLADYAFELVKNVCSLDQLPDLIRTHIDYDSIGKDLELNSEVA